VGQTYPSSNSFNRGDYTGGGAASATGQSASLPNAATFTTPFLGAGGSVLKVLWEATQTLTCRVRSSATKPPVCGTISQPGASEWSAYGYDPASNAGDPTPQGWTGSGMSYSTSSGYTRFTGNAGSYYYRTTTGSLSNRYHVMRWRMRRNAGHAGTGGVYYASVLGLVTVYVNGSGALIVNGNTIPGVTMATGDYWDFAIVGRTDGSARTSLRLWAAPAGSASQQDISHLLDYGELVDIAAAGNQINLVYAAIGGLDLTYGEFRHFAGDEWVTVSSGNAPATAGARPWIQTELTNGSGNAATLTDLDIGSDATAPSVISNVLATGVGSDLYVRSGSSADTGRVFRLLDASDTVLDEWELPCLGFGFTGLADGQYAGSVAPVTDDGVTGSFTRSPAAGTLTIPPTAPAVTLTVDDAALSPGQAATLSYAFSGGASGTLNGGAISGTGSAVVATSDPAATIALTVDDATLAPGDTAKLSASKTGVANLTLGGSSWDGTVRTIVTGIAGPTPSVALTVDDSTITPGQAAKLTASKSGTVDLTLAGSAWDGTAQTVATGVDGPPATVAVTIAPDTVESGEVAAATWAVTGNAALTLNGTSRGPSGTADVVTGTGGSGPGAVALAVSPATVRPGEESTLTWDAPGSTVTLGGSPVADTGSAGVVTGLPDEGSTPPDAVTWMAGRLPGVVRWTVADGGFRISGPTIGAGQSALASYTLVRRAAGAADETPFAIDTTQDTNPVDYGDLVWVDGVADPGWERVAGWDYRVRPLDVGGRTGPDSATLSGSDQAEHECTVTFAFDPADWGTASTAATRFSVSGEIPAAVVLGNQTYLRTGYTAVIQEDGTAQVIGCPRGQVMTWRMPDRRTSQTMTIPDAASAAFDPD
jgi:hypothetical protein